MRFFYKEELKSNMKIMRYLFFLLAYLIGIHLTSAQMFNNGSMYIHDGVSVYVSSGTYYFANPSQGTFTSRGSGPGVLAFGPGVNTVGESNAHFVDGYAATYEANSFVLPVGQSGVLAPLKVQSSANVETRAAYFRSTPTFVGSALAFSIASISNVEYWQLNGNQPTVIAISWRSSSNISGLVGGNLNRLTIAGWDGNAWNEIPSIIDNTSFSGTASSMTSGSITSITPIDLSTFTHFTLGVKAPSCLPLEIPSGITRTWNGTWDGPTPTLADAVVINAPYTGSLQCNSIVLNADVTVIDGQTLDIVNGATGPGKVIMSSEASLVQRNDSASAPNIQLTKVTNPMRRLDYVFLSSPINNMTTYMANLTNRFSTAVNGNFGLYPASAFYFFQTYNTTGTAYVTASASNVPIGKGLSAVVASQAPYATTTTAGSWFTEKYPVYIRTTGTTNNGVIPVSIPANGWLFLGNPYPSAISGEKLLDAVGSTMRKTLYFWTHSTPRASWNNSGSNYNNADFATWNYSGGVAACSGCQVPNGKIASMQSVLMRSITPTTTTLNLNNCLREVTGNDNFFRVTPTDRFWLNLIGSNGSFCQALIAYSPSATVDEDQGYDSLKLGGATSASLTSLIGSSRYAIQTRSSFEVSDEVPLQVDRPNVETLQIVLDSKEGVFSEGDVSIFLIDNLLGTSHNLTTDGPYSFVQSSLNDSTRFKIVYQTQLSTPEFSEGSKAFSYILENQFFAQASETIESIQIFDLNGRKVAHYPNINARLVQHPFQQAQGVYLVKIYLQNGFVYDQKLINY